MDTKFNTFSAYIPEFINKEKLINSFETAVPVSLRINPNKIKERLPLSPVLWSEHGYYLPQRPVFTLDPLFHAGAYYVQEASSMFIEHILRPIAHEPLKVFDVCASPGGKSTHIISLLKRGSLLLSNEVIRSRAHVLSENIIKWGKSNCIVTNNDPKDFNFLQGYFDVLVVDAPCSGEGMFRKDPDAFNEWSPQNVELCSARQKRILFDVWDCLKPGGILIYSTCTFNEKENEDVMHEFMQQTDAECFPIPLVPSWNIVENKKNGVYSYRFFPHKVKGEGFSVTVLHKTAGQEYKRGKKLQKSKISIVPEKNKLHYSSLIQNYTSVIYEVEKEKNVLWSFASSYKDILQDIYSHCNVIHAGIPLVEIIGNKLNPLPGLAFANSFNQNVLPHVEVDLETALRYFKKEAIQLPDMSKGWIQLQYKGISIGFVKNIGNRANNPYPQHWSIRMNIDTEKMWSII